MSIIEKLVRRVADRTIELQYRTSNWGEGVAQYALARAGAELKETRYTAEVEAFLRDNKALKPTSLEHVMPSAAALAVYESAGNQLGLDLAQRVATMLEDHPRRVTSGGVVCESVSA